MAVQIYLHGSDENENERNHRFGVGFRRGSRGVLESRNLVLGAPGLEMVRNHRFGIGFRKGCWNREIGPWELQGSKWNEIIGLD